MSLKRYCDRCDAPAAKDTGEFTIASRTHAIDLCEGCYISLHLWFTRMTK